MLHRRGEQRNTQRQRILRGRIRPAIQHRRHASLRGGHTQDGCGHNTRQHIRRQDHEECRHAWMRMVLGRRQPYTLAAAHQPSQLVREALCRRTARGGHRSGSHTGRGTQARRCLLHSKPIPLYRPDTDAYAQGERQPVCRVDVLPTGSLNRQPTRYRQRCCHGNRPTDK